MAEKGYVRVNLTEQPDIVIINTCTVTAAASKKCRQAINRIHHIAPQARIIATGCYAQLQPDELSAIPGITLIVGNKDKSDVDKWLNEIGVNKTRVTAIADVDEFTPAYSSGQRTRSFLKIQDGCDYFCAYCTVPHARGPSRSPHITDILKQAEIIVISGVKEIVLTGVNIGDFGRKNGQNLHQLLCELENIPGLGRLRISSIEPNLLNDEIIRQVAGSHVIAPHFHIPLQNGTDKLLSLMKRRYDTSLFLRKTEYIHQLIPQACIAADLIVGVPGETDTDFEQTLLLIENSEISYLHLFPYSERKNTLAAGMKGKVDEKTKKQRMDILTAVSERKWKQFCHAAIGQKHKVLFESSLKQGKMYGLTGNYVKFVTGFDAGLINQFREVVIEHFTPEGDASGLIL